MLMNFSDAQCIVNGGLCSPHDTRTYCCGICQLQPPTYTYGICING